ncbi:NRDE protein-domain-containing protein [Catenaria anguillulae PL171]|uniref:NRDE protein-domain-containing protein n=1 Tax=Catenaria anguillulae PL171 TaxID=765915 RepID=A0A1Y2I7Q5_9FUNG|nr:NRDE protein-domain-containing protein [Catenaria anguillulae PL171]
MCIVFLAFGNSIHPDHKLIIASNRDEYFDRPTHRAHVWPAHGPMAPDGHRVVCGVDLERDDHGTWLGLATNPASGRFAFVTNFREPIPLRMKHDKKPNFTDYESRGRLVSDFLHSTVAPSAYAAQLRAETSANPNAWLGFNLVFGTSGSESEFDVWYVSNRKGSWHEDPKRYMDRDLVTFRLAPGVVWGVSNGSIVPLTQVPAAVMGFTGEKDGQQEDGGQIVTLSQVERPFWAKVERGIARIDAMLQRSKNGDEKVDLVASCGRCSDPTRADRSELPCTGVPEVIEHALSSIFVPAASMSKGFSGGASYYGTRSSTLVFRDHDLPLADATGHAGERSDLVPAPATRPNAVLPPDVSASLDGCEAPPVEDCSWMGSMESRERVEVSLFGEVVRGESPSILE